MALELDVAVEGHLCHGRRQLSCPKHSYNKFTVLGFSRHRFDGDADSV
jgi:hypothetical protein